MYAYMHYFYGRSTSNMAITTQCRQFHFSHGVGCRKKSFMLGVQDVGKIRILIFKQEITGIA